METIEDVYGRVRHTVDARVIGPGIQLLNNWHVSKPVLVLRAYMSDSLLTMNSLQDLSRTYEKHLPAADVQLVVERAAFSSGDLFYLKLILEPHRKRVRLDHMELTVTESRRYHVSEVKANRQDSEQFTLPFLASAKLVEGGEWNQQQGSDLRSAFLTKEKGGKGVDLMDTVAYRMTFATPTCMRNIHHTTYYKDILFRHHLNINMSLSFVDDSPEAAAAALGNNSRPTSTLISASSNNSSTSSFTNEEIATPVVRTPSIIEQSAAEAMRALSPPPAAAFSSFNTTHLGQRQQHSNLNNTAYNNNLSLPPPTIIHQHNNNNNTNTNSTTTLNLHQQAQQQQQSHWLSKLKKPVNTKEGGTQVIRKRETIRLETPVTIFDCRLKEDYGRLPSYSELNITSSSSKHTTNDDKSIMMAADMLTANSSPDGVRDGTVASGDEGGEEQQDYMLQCMPDSDQQIPSIEPQPQLCPCYFKFRRQMEMASQAQLLAVGGNTTTEPAVLERIPSRPPPDYVETA